MLRNKGMPNSKKTQIDRRAVDLIITALETRSTSIHHFVNETFGIKAWFHAYFGSDEFNRLTMHEQTECIDTFKHMYTLSKLIEGSKKDIAEYTKKLGI